MASITEYLNRLQKLTQTNLDILQALNDSFFTRKNHISVNIGDNQYAIPSFISLENKLNSIQANLENLINSPSSGEAFFNFDGNSRSIQVRPYTSVPNSLILDNIDTFDVENNDIFKDFLTPNPYVNIKTNSLPNDITNVVVKKIIPIHEDLIKEFSSNIGDINSSIQYPFQKLYKKLSLYKQDVDYIEYDTKVGLPIHKSIGSGVYVIKDIKSDIIDENLDNYITVQFRNDMDDDTIYMNDLSYRLFDETIKKPLKVGDQLTTFEGNAKVEVTELKNDNTLTFKVLHGEFLNLVNSTTNNPKEISELSKMRFFSPVDFDDKYVKVSLEEDQYVFIAIAALNDRMNVQSSWGTGLMINTFNLVKDGENSRFKTYYNENVRNIGDALLEISSMSSNTLFNISESNYNSFTKDFKPSIDLNNLVVTRINSHLNDSSTVRNIRAMYSQKKNIQEELNQILSQIENINKELSTISFDDTTGIRESYSSKLAELAKKRSDLSTSIIKISNDIAVSANNSEVPIENAKYRIRGFYNYEEVDKINTVQNLKDHVRGIHVRYRYKNIEQEQGNALSINKQFLFSDWNYMNSFDREKIVEYNNGYKFHPQPNSDTKNEPSFNQIDIPISQGETVDIQIRILYDYGYPFVTVASDWSDITNIKFPEEYLKDVKILDIIEENNNDIETNRFNNILKDGGITSHIDDKLQDQDVTYYHRPENIPSGFYTSERRVIPLKDKLSSLDSAIMQLKDEVFGTSTDTLKVSIKHGSTINELEPYQYKNISVDDYSSFSSFTEGSSVEGNYEKDNKTNAIITVLNISIYNDSEHTSKLYSMFPGGRDVQISELKNYKYDKLSYTKGKNNGVWFMHPTFVCPYCDHLDNGDNKEITTKSIQGGNQFIYFRINDINNGAQYYGEGDKQGDNILSTNKDFICLDDYKESELSKTKYAFLYPKLSDRYGLCINSDSVGSHIVLAPHEEIIIPIVFEYYLTDGQEISKTMSFEILPSLYKDPIAYTFKVTAKYQDTIQDKIIKSNKTRTGNLLSSMTDRLFKSNYK